MGRVQGRGSQPALLKLRDLLLVRSQESRHFAAYETYEGAGEHLVRLPSGVLKVVVWVSQNVKQCLNQFFILWERKKKTGCKPHMTTFYPSLEKQLPMNDIIGVAL